MFGTADGTRYRMHHDQDCCEHVYIEDIDGDIEDLIGDPILLAEEASGSNDPPLNEHWESHTWTFYKLRNIKASITIRWFGCSNGYYSESVSFVQLDD